MRVESLVVVIEEINDGYAHVIDQYSRRRRIPMEPQRSKGPAPVVGEQWIIDHALDGVTWTFAAIFSPLRPTITGSRSNGSALANLLDAMEAMGLIEDDTTP